MREKTLSKRGHFKRLQRVGSYACERYSRVCNLAKRSPVYGTYHKNYCRSIGYFGGYEGIKRLLTPDGQDPEKLNPFRTFVAGGLAGLLLY